MKKYSIALLMMSAVTANIHAASANDDLSPYVDDKGTISFPQDFRTQMVHLGSWFVPEGGASGFHGVYTEKATVDAYRKTGEFPDGATLVKALRAHNSGDYTTGTNVSHETPALKQWFVMVKDSTGRFSDNGSWGDGWGWALFKTDDLTQNASTNYKTDCLGCHIPAKDKDWIYTEAYPILSD
ncbi:cytochrome P460 family protein [Enterovibrio calviensis]|uniref:cytochrome P460 family protein n=1 Tax=Enterovibrio calviensis TaxID=91359 RepID=UPI0037353EBD